MDPQPDPALQARRLAAIVEGSDDAIISKDVNGVITSWNAAAERMFGYAADEVIGRSIRIIVPPDRQPEEDMVLERVRRGERVEPFETIRRRRDGELLDVSIAVSPMRTVDGRIIGASKIARDISDRKHTERALVEARAEQAELRKRLSTIIDASGSLLLSPRFDDVLPAILVVARQLLPADATAVWRADSIEWRIAASHGLSDGFVTTTISRNKERERAAGDLVTIESIDDPIIAARRDLYAGEGIASMMLAPLQVDTNSAGLIAFYHRTPHVFTTVERESALGLGRLASAVIATAQMYDSQRRRRVESDFIAEAGSILVSAPDYRDTLTRVADRVVPLLADWCAFHLVREDSVLERIAIAAPSGIQPDQLERFMRTANDPADAFSVDLVFKTGVAALVGDWSPQQCGAWAESRVAAGRAAGVKSVIVVPLVAHGRTLGTLTIGSLQSGHAFGPAELRFAQDLAYRTALSIDNVLSYEEARNANRLKDEFLATLSHELRTPLNAIVGYAQMLRKGAMPEDRRTRAYEVLDKNARTLTQIVEDVLDISRIVAGKIRLQLSPVPLAPIIVQSVETVQPGADAKGVRIDLHADDSNATVAGDGDRLQQVFWNLLSNAVKFTPRQGTITVSVGQRNGTCEVTVSDDGTGIDPKFLPHIFERFRQADSRFGREHGGLGLGLAIARQIVEMHGGTITAESAGPGQGATFRVALPALEN